MYVSSVHCGYISDGRYAVIVGEGYDGSEELDLDGAFEKLQEFASLNQYEYGEDSDLDEEPEEEACLDTDGHAAE